MRLLLLAEQDVGWLIIRSAANCCISSKVERGCLKELCKASNIVWK